MGSAALQPDQLAHFLITFGFNHFAWPVVKSGISMEFLLNSAWALVAIVSVCLWLRQGRRATADRRMSFVGLVMLIVILFPVISVSDDLWSIQNPAETDTYQRRDHLASSPHCLFPVISALPQPAFGEPNFEFGGLDVLFEAPPRAVDNPACFSIQNRPPPAV